MNKPEFVTNITRSIHKAGFQIKKHSPEILVVAGVIGTVASAVMACKATLKVNEVLENAKNDVDKIHEATEKGVTEAGKPYTPEDSKKELTIVYAHTVVEFAKLYGPAVILGTLSIAGILASNNILRKRNIALAAAYTAVDNGFKEYRERVVERFGKELDRELKYNLKAKEVEEIIMNEDGSETVVKKTVEVADDNLGYSPYAVIYAEGCKGWTKDPELNKYFLMECQEYANIKLKEQGYLLLNDVYDMIGMSKTKAGHTIGWLYDLKDTTLNNHVDFGIFDIHSERKIAFVNGLERNIVIDPNVDGDIYDRMF